MRTILNSLPAFWLLLAVPAFVQLTGWAGGAVDAADMLHPTGETSARLMLAAMLIGPLIGLAGPRRWLLWLLARRRSLGVAASAYALLHLLFYVADMGGLDAILGELPIPAIWTGWLAFALLLAIAAVSNRAGVRALGAAWKPVQRLVYPAALLTLLHWWWVHDGAGAALAHFIPLAAAWLLLALRGRRRARLFPQAPQPGA